MITIIKKPEVLYPARSKEWSAVDTIIALMVVVILGGILYCVSYLDTPQSGTSTSRDAAKFGDSAWKATASGSSKLPLPMPLPFPMPPQLSAPVVNQGVGDSIRVEESSSRVGTARL
jgi:hypothetical protein